MLEVAENEYSKAPISLNDEKVDKYPQQAKLQCKSLSERNMNEYE